jgi:putative membrane protein (TIGR04086 family)
MYSDDNEVKGMGVYTLTTHIKGLAFGYGFIAIVLVIFSAIESMVTKLTIDTLPLIIVSTLALVISGGYSAVRIRRKGWLQGAFNGILFFGISVLLSSIMTKNYGLSMEGTHILFRAFYCTTVAAIGGIIGVNLF